MNQEPSNPPLPVETIPPKKSSPPILPMLVLFVLGVMIGVSGVKAYEYFGKRTPVTSYEECVKAKGSKLLTSYPGICVTEDGKSFPEPTQQMPVSPTPETGTPSGSMCGGIAGIQCPKGSTCKLDGNYPDASGKCVSSSFTCPKTEWVDCMPSPNAGIKFECTPEYLGWAKANCPGFQGAAY